MVCVAVAEKRLFALESFSMKMDPFSPFGTVVLVLTVDRFWISTVKTWLDEVLLTNPTQCNEDLLIPLALRKYPWEATPPVTSLPASLTVI